MKCPNCASVFQVWDHTCNHCGIKFVDWFERRARESAKPLAAPPDPLPSRPRRVPWGAALLLGIGGLLAAWCCDVRFRPLGAFRNLSARLSFVPPPGWRLEKDLGENWRFRSVARLTRPGARIEVEIPKEELPADRVMENLAVLVQDEFKGRRPVLGKLSDARVGGLPARRIPFKAGRTQGEAVFTRGAGGGFLFRYYSEGRERPQNRAEWEAFLGSVRPLPPPLALWLAAATSAAAALGAAAWLVSGALRDRDRASGPPRRLL